MIAKGIDATVRAQVNDLSAALLFSLEILEQLIIAGVDKKLARIWSLKALWMVVPIRQIWNLAHLIISIYCWSLESTIKSNLHLFW